MAEYYYPALILQVITTSVFQLKSFWVSLPCPFVS